MEVEEESSFVGHWNAQLLLYENQSQIFHSIVNVPAELIIHLRICCCVLCCFSPVHKTDVINAIFN